MRDLKTPLVLFALLVGAPLVGGCAQIEALGGGAAGETAEETGPRPVPRPSALAAPPETARTVEEFDTTTAEDRAAATQTTSGGSLLGQTIASLGAAAEPGFWLKTPLVGSERAGRVVYPATGASVEVTLLPIEGEAGSGSRLSLAAMRLLGAPLTGLPTIEVYANP